MRWRIERDTLRDALRRVAPGVAKNGGVIPALRCVLISAGPAGLTLTTCDLDSRISTVVDSADVIAEGMVAVPHERISQLVGRAKPGAIDCSLDAHELTVAANGGSLVAVLNTVDAREFPQWSNAKGDPVDIAADWLAITNVMHARNVKDPSRPAMTHISVGDGWAWATDSYRLARQPVAVDLGRSILLPGAMVESVARMVGPAAGLTLTVDERRFDLEHDGTIWSGVLLDGQIAEWSAVTTMYDRPRPASIEVDRLALIDGIMAVGAIGTEQREATGGHTHTTAVVHLAATDGSDVLVIDGKHSEYGHVTVDIEVSVNGGDVDTSFNGALLLDALGACESDRLSLDFDDGFKPVGIVDDELELLIMPFRVTK